MTRAFRIRRISSWLRLAMFRIRRRSRRLSTVPTNIAHFRRSRASTVSTYYSAADDENKVDFSDRISPADPNHHEDTSLEPFRPWKIDYIEMLEPVSQKVKEEHAFNPEDSSPHIYIKEDDNLTMHRLPIAQSTDAIRGKVGFARGMHVWKIRWPNRQRGTNAVIGVATAEHSLRTNGYVSLIGSEESGYGWDIVKNYCSHNSKEKDMWAYPDPNLFENFSAPAEIFCILDMDEGYLAFSTQDNFLGVAFRGLKGLKLYPVISSVWGHCNVTMEYMGSLYKVPPLLEICRRQVRKEILRDEQCSIDDLPISNQLKDYMSIEPHPVW